MHEKVNKLYTIRSEIKGISEKNRLAGKEFKSWDQEADKIDRCINTLFDYGLS